MKRDESSNAVVEIVRMKRNGLMRPLFLGALACSSALWAADAPLVDKVEWQPLSAQVQRLVEALDLLGAPLKPETKLGLEELRSRTNSDQSAKELQKILDPLCLFLVEINPE